MKSILGLLAVSVLVLGSLVYAEMPTASSIKILLKAASGELEDLQAAKALVKTLSQGSMKNREGMQALANQKYIIGSTGKEFDTDVVVKAVPYATPVSIFNGKQAPILALSRGDLQVAIARGMQGELQSRLMQAIALGSEDAVLNAANPSHFIAMKYILRYENQESEKLGAIAQDSMTRFGNGPSNVTIADPAIVKISEGRYLLIRGVNINAHAIDPAQVQELIDAAKGML